MSLEQAYQDEARKAYEAAEKATRAWDSTIERIAHRAPVEAGRTERRRAIQEAAQRQARPWTTS